MSNPAIYQLNAIAPFLWSANTRRVDFALIGDSNTHHSQTSGHSQGMQKAFAKRYGMYATELLPASSQGPYTDLYYVTAAASTAFDAPPGTHTQYLMDQTNGWFPTQYVSLQSGVLVPDLSRAIQLVDDLFFDISKAFRWRYDYATFSSGSGVFYPTCRATPFQDHEVTATVNTNTGVNGMAIGVLDVPARSDRTSVNNYFLWFTHWLTGGSNVVAPFLGLWVRGEDPNLATGIGYSTLLYQGGEPTRIAAQSLQAMNQAAFTQWAKMLVAGQVGPPMLCVQIIQGQNDDGDGGNNSLGPSPADSATVAGVVDNHNACIIRLRALWVGAGYSLGNLYFLLGPYHPQLSHAHEAKTAGLRVLSDTTYNVAVMDGDLISDPTTMRANGWYYNDGSPSTDDFHLTALGYDFWGDAAVARLEVSSQNISSMIM